MKALSFLFAILAIATQFSLAAPAVAATKAAVSHQGICGRNRIVSNAILESVKKKCENVLPADLARVETIHLWSDTGPLNASDFEGLTGAKLLILQQLSEGSNGAATFKHLTSLETLSINYPGAMPANWTEGLGQLKALELGPNGGAPTGADFPYEDLGKLPHLQEILFSSMIVDLSRIQRSFDTRNLRKIWFYNYSQVSNLNKETLALFPGLKELSLSDLTIDDSLFAGTPDLESLTLGALQLKYGKGWARTMPRLRKLELMGFTEFDASDLMAKSGLRTLEKLVSFNQVWSCPNTNPFAGMQIETFEAHLSGGIASPECADVRSQMKKSVKNWVWIDPGP